MRIDAGRGSLPGVSRGLRTTPAANGFGQLGRGVQAIGRAMQRNELEAEREAEVQQAKADRVTLAKAAQSFRSDMTAYVDEQAAEYDGAEPGFAERIGEQSLIDMEERIAGLDPRLAADAQLSLGSVREAVTLAAQRTERSRRDEYQLRGIRETIDGEASAVGRDASLIGMARDNIDLAVSAAPAAIQAELKREAYESLGLSAISYYQEFDPGEGLRQLDSGDMSRFLDAKQEARARSIFRAEIQRREDKRQREQEKAQRLLERDLKSELDEMKRAREAGLPVSTERREAALQKAMALGGDTAETMQIELAAQQAADALKTMPLNEARAQARGIRQQAVQSGDVTRAQTIFVETADKTVEGMEKALAKDPIAFAMRERGGIDPLDWKADPLGSLRRRAVQAKEATDYYGVPDRMMTDEETTMLAAALDEASTQEKAVFLDALGKAGTPQLMAELAPKAPVMTYLAGLQGSGGDTAFTSQVLEGQRLRREQNAKATYSAFNVRGLTEDVYGNAFALRPDLSIRAMEAAGYAYDYSAMREGRDGDSFKTDEFDAMMRKAVGQVGDGRDATGGIADMGAAKVWVPPGIRTKDFPRLYRRAPDEAFKAGLPGDAYSRDGRVIPVSVLKLGVPVAVDAGLYRISLAADGNGRWAMDENGEPILLNFNKVFTATKGGP